jgi:Mg2+ and Co2+ transporter CorA
MNLRLLNEHTYERWTDYNTLFGISRYSFITISENNDYTRNDLLLPHLKNMYFQMIRLCLAQRASILRFSSEVTILSSLNEKTSRITDNISTLTKAYLQFVNKMYFREVTAQEQGIEIYDKIQEFMRIERDVKDLNREIDELHQYARLLQDMKKRKQMNRIQIFGVILIVPALIAGIFGMNTFKQAEIQTYLWKSVSVLLTIALPIIAAITYLLIAYSKRKKNG